MNGVTWWTRDDARSGAQLAAALLMVLAGAIAEAQTPAGFELTLFDIDGTSKSWGGCRQPSTRRACRPTASASRSRRAIAADGPRLWVADSRTSPGDAATARAGTDELGADVDTRR